MPLFFRLSQLYELVNGEGTQYRLTLESADQIIHLRSMEIMIGGP